MAYNNINLLKKLLEAKQTGDLLPFWLETNMVARGWSLEELGKRAGTNRQVVHNHIQGKSSVNFPQMLTYILAFDGCINNDVKELLDVYNKLRGEES